MAMTKVADLGDSIHARYEKEYMLEAARRPGVWAQFIDWQPPINETAGNGSSFNYTTYGESDFTETALTEDADVTPDSITDGTMALTPYEYGKTWSVSKLARYQSMQPIEQVMAKIANLNRVQSIDRIIRRGAVGHGSSLPTMRYHIDGGTAMSSLEGHTATDEVTYEFLATLTAYAASTGLEPFDGLGYTAIIHPLLALDIQQLTEWKSMGYYQDQGKITSSLMRPFTLAGITFIPSHEGRIYLGAGAATTIYNGSTAMTATDLNGALNKGATQIVVTSDTNCSVGQYLTIGTKETETTSPGSNLEQVLVTGIGSTPTIDIKAMGVGNDFGLRFDHADAEAVACTSNVAAIPLLGKQSILGIHGSDCGRYGKAITKEGLDLLDRFKYFGWYWYGGVATVQKRVILGKCVLPHGHLGYN